MQRRNLAVKGRSRSHGRFHDFELDTTVDSESAKYYIESYAQGKVDNPQLHQAIEQLKRDFGGGVPDHLDLRGLAHTYSVDFAALFFADQVCLSEFYLGRLAWCDPAAWVG